MKESSLDAFNWHSAIAETYQELSRQIIGSAPKVIGAIALLLLGYVIAHVLRLSVQKLVQGFDSLFKRVPKESDVKQEQIKKSYARIIGKVTFWSVLIFFVASSANLLEWKMFTGMMDSLVRLLPIIVSGLLIVFGGVLFGNGYKVCQRSREWVM